MKKVFYFLLLAIEAFVGSMLMNLAWNNTMEIASVAVSVITVAMLIWQIVLLCKATDAAAKKKFKRNIALVLLIPLVAFIIMLLWLIIGLSRVI